MRTTTLAGFLCAVTSLSCVAGSRPQEVPPPPSVSASSAASRPVPACTVEGAAALATRMEEVTSSEDVAAVSAVLSEPSAFRWVSDANTKRVMRLNERDAAAKYLADANTPRYDIQEVHILRRGKAHAVDVVFTAIDARGRLVLGKALFLCVPPSVAAWTIGSGGAGTRELCTTSESIDVYDMTACGP
jgi:hypothetical protein